MFERRLKICLGILLSVMSILLLRAFHLQVLTRSDWVKAANDFKKKAQYIETTRGRILDVKGKELAVDEACMNACIDYRAITRDPDWIRGIARDRADDDVDAWSKASRDQKTDLVDMKVAEVTADLDNTIDMLAKETGVSVEQIEETCRQIDMRIAMSRRRRQYHRYVEASGEHVENQSASWVRRWLIEGGKDGPQIDDFEMTEGAEVGVHPVVRNISPEVYMRLARHLPRSPGLSLQPGTSRNYPFGRAACHLLGAVSIVKKEDMEADPNLGVDPLREYRFNDVVGRGGLESLCEPSLRGTRGRAFRRDEQDDEIEAAPVPGTDVKCTIDIDLQDQLQKLFEHMEVPSNKFGEENRRIAVAMHGAAVVIDVKTGAVRALASYPDYDPNQLSEQYEALAAQKLELPLLNRATQSQREPGSTIKPVVGIAAITQGLNVPGLGVMTTQRGIECSGFLVLGGHKLPNGRCWVASKFYDVLGGKVAHHPVPPHSPHQGVFGNPNGFLCFADALERSCNVYFETIADAFGVDGLSYWYDRFGLGHETGLGISESRGYLPREVPHQQASVAWFSGIGQSGVGATPIQMANVAATIARDGVWVRPHLVEDGYTLNPIRPKDGREIPERVDLKLSREALAAARDGMVRVVNSRAGTGSYARMADVVVAGKTGTAQAPALTEYARDAAGSIVLNEKGRPIRVALPLASADHPTGTPWYRGWGEAGDNTNHAWFIGFAPAENPQVAFAVMVEYGGSGGATAGRAATKVLSACIENGYIKAAPR